MEEDEEVILKNSALYSHLHDVGFTEFEVSTSQNSSIVQEKYFENKNFVRKNEKNWLFVKFCKWLMTLLKFEELRNRILHNFALRLIKSKILVESDLLTLESFSNTIDYLVTNPELLKFEEPEANLSVHKKVNSFLLLSIIFGLLSILVTNFDVRICIIFTSLSLGYIFYSYLWKVILRNKSNFLNEIAQTIGDANKIIFTTNKIMNEIKVIGKGLSNDGAFLNASYEVCLVEGIFKLLESFSSILIAGHLVIEKRRYLSEWESMKEIFAGRLVTIITKPEDKEIMLTQIKIKFSLFLDQSSAFLTELFLHLEKDYSHFYWMNINDIISKKSIDTLNQQIHMLTKLRNLASNYWFDEKENKSIFSFHPTRKSYESVKSDVHGALASLYVHSRLAVNNILILRNFVEETLDINKNTNEIELLDDVQKKCDSIKNEFLSCMGCLDEVWDRAQRFYFPKLEQLNNFPQIFVSSKDIDSSCSDRISIMGLTDNVPVDEVFEATVGEESKTLTLNDENDFWLSNIKQDKITRRKQMERCRRVLQEIQPILQQRREMWEEREKIALQCKNERKCEDLDIYMDKSKNLELNQVGEEGEHVEEIPLVIPFFVSDNIKSKNSVAENKITNFQCDDEYDSDEERLKIYRRVKQELYEDELRRLAEDEAEEEEDYLYKQQLNDFLPKERLLNLEDISLKPKNRADNGDMLNSICSCRNDVCNCNGYNKRPITDTDRGNQIDKLNLNLCISKRNDHISLDEISSSDSHEVKNKYLKHVEGPSESHFECCNTKNEMRSDTDEGVNSLSSPSSMSVCICASRSSSFDLASPQPLSPMDSHMFMKEFKSSQINDISIHNTTAAVVPQSFSKDEFTAEQNLSFNVNNNEQLHEKLLSEYSGNLNDYSNSDSNSSETYTCGNDNIDNDNHSIDWSTCGFPSSKNLRLEDRFMPDHDGWLSRGSFNPFLTSETLQANSTLRKFNLSEEIFGGIGEGEDEPEKENL